MARGRVVARAPMPSARRRVLVGGVFLAAAVLIVAAQWVAYDPTPISQQNRARALVAGAVLAVVGVRMVLVRRQQEIGVRAAMLAAASLVFFAVLAPHERESALLVECVCGVSALIAALAALPPVEPPRR